MTQAAARLIVPVLLPLLFAVTARSAQEQKAPVALTPSARLNAAKSVFMKDGGGSNIPFDVISSALEGWGRFTMVDSLEKADIVVEVSAPSGTGGVSVSSSTRPSGTNTGRPEQNTSTTRELSSGPVKMSVYDPKSKMPLWSASEQPKFAMKQKGREDNLVNAAQHLITKFRERMDAAGNKK